MSVVPMKQKVNISETLSQFLVFYFVLESDYQYNVFCFGRSVFSFQIKFNFFDVDKLEVECRYLSDL